MALILGSRRNQKDLEILLTDRNKHLASNATFTHSDVRHFFVSIIYFNLLPQVNDTLLCHSTFEDTSYNIQHYTGLV